MSEWINYAGEICAGKEDASSRYIKVLRDFTALAGNYLMYTPHKAYLQDKVNKGFITESEMEQKLKRDWVKGVLTVPPQEEKEGKSAEISSRDEWQNDILQIILKPDGRIYVSVKKSFKAVEGDVIKLTNAVTNLHDLCEKGIINEQKRDESLEFISMKDANGNKIANKFWLQYKGTLPPLK